MKATATIPAKNDGGFGLSGGNRNRWVVRVGTEEPTRLDDGLNFNDEADQGLDQRFPTFLAPESGAPMRI